MKYIHANELKEVKYFNILNNSTYYYSYDYDKNKLYNYLTEIFEHCRFNILNDSLKYVCIILHSHELKNNNILELRFFIKKYYNQEDTHTYSFENKSELKSKTQTLSINLFDTCLQTNKVLMQTFDYYYTIRSINEDFNIFKTYYNYINTDVNINYNEYHNALKLISESNRTKKELYGTIYSNKDKVYIKKNTILDELNYISNKE